MHENLDKLVLTGRVPVGRGNMTQFAKDLLTDILRLHGYTETQMRWPHRLNCNQPELGS